jgi:hypothetical protein
MRSRLRIMHQSDRIHRLQRANTGVAQVRSEISMQSQNALERTKSPLTNIKYGSFVRTRLFDSCTQHIYQRFLGPLSRDDTAPFLMIEIGFAAGWSAAAFREFLPRGELHEVEIGCVKEKAAANKNEWIYNAPMFSVMRTEGRLHCGSGADGTIEYLP